MQRNINDKNFISYILILLGYIFYLSLSSMYLFLPPLFSILFFYFVKAIDKENFLFLLAIVFLLIVYESEKTYLMFSSILYFLLIYKFILPRLYLYIQCKVCNLFLYTLFAYLGFYAFTYLISQVLWIDTPSLDWYVAFYILFEFMVLLIL